MSRNPRDTKDVHNLVTEASSAYNEGHDIYSLADRIRHDHSFSKKEVQESYEGARDSLDLWYRPELSSMCQSLE